MKILFLAQNLGTGVARQIALLAEHLSRRGHQVSVLGLFAEDADRRLFLAANIESGGLLRTKSPSRLFRCLQLLCGAAALRSLLRKKQIEIVYAFDGDLVRIISWLATRGRAARLVWGKQGSGPRDSPFHNRWSVYLPFRLTHWLSVSVPLRIINSDAGLVGREIDGYRGVRQIVIHNGFDDQKFKPDAAARARVRSEWKIANEKLIGIVGRLNPRKGPQVFLAAAALLCKERSDVRFVVVGDGRDRKRLELLGGELGLAENVIWAGEREDMPEVYNAMDILCSPSLSEGFSNVVGEAMASGVPCVVTDVGDSARAVGATGITVPPGDAPALAAGLSAMLDRLAGVEPGRIRERIVKQFGLQAMIDATEKALTEVAGR